MILVCTICFLWHSGYNIYQNTEGSKYIDNTKHVPLSSIPFPIIFQFSVEPGINILKNAP